MYLLIIFCINNVNHKVIKAVSNVMEYKQKVTENGNTQSTGTSSTVLEEMYSVTFHHC